MKTAIIMAGGSGMGAACARRLAEEGHRVAILSSSGKGEALARELGGIGVTGTNRSQADIDRLVAMAVEKWGRIDALVNSAGHGPRGAVDSLTDADWAEGMETYLLAYLRPIRAVTPHMVAARTGAIVNITSYVAIEPDAAFPTSAVFRAGLSAFTKMYSDAHARDGIRINNVLPGFIDSLPENPAWKAKAPIGRYGTVAEIAATVSFLLSDGAGYILGQNLRVDGGITRSA
jgi:NAD(P)-dependent dehydrogenase (short-subunit alcohol dehydrogenase family)